ncbi:mucin-15 [Tachysurus fulvidraco]|uniref:mucin-15 n=1 Tax=Tachysurus fulvidraco TaxID=1234273 RepID=UPI000F5123E2|nr:mucin-15 [Tachysurus fulvidraco]
MQGKHASKMPSGTAFVLLLTLQSLQLVSTQTANPGNEETTSLLFSEIPDNWKRVNDEDNGISSGSMPFSGDDEYQAYNKTDIAVKGQYDVNTNTTASPQTTVNVNDNSSSLQNDTSNLFTLSPSLEPATTNDSNVNLTETNTTTPSPGNSTTAITVTNATSTADFNITQHSTSEVSENFTTTSPPQVSNYTNSPSENVTNMTVSTTSTNMTVSTTSSNMTVSTTSTNMTVSTTSTNMTVSTMTTMQTSVYTTEMNITGVSLDIKGNMDRGLAADNEQQSKTQAWGAILGIGVAVAIVAMVIFIIVKRRNYREFSHRKLEEDSPPEPVLRLENSEPLDLKFDGFAYYNPGLQGDNIQMTNFPQGYTK